MFVQKKKKTLKIWNLLCLYFVLQKIPHIGPITGGIRPGMALYVHGTVLADDSQYVLYVS